MTSDEVVLVELNADRIGGHWPDRLIRLAAAASQQRIPVTVAVLMGCAPSTRQTLQRHGATIIDRPDQWDIASRGLLLAGKALGHLSDLAGWARPIRSSKWQFTLLSWCLIEAASLRAAAYQKPSPRPAYVVMTASGALHGLTRRLAGVAHLRIVHELLAREGNVLHLLSRVGRSCEGEVIVVCLTEAVAHEHRTHYPGVSEVVHGLAINDTSDYLTEQERMAARSHYAVQADEVVISLVGGWWPYKDMATIVRACHLVNQRLRVIVAGTPLHEGILGELASAPNVTLDVLHKELETSEHRQVYAAADFSIVARHAGVAKSSGLVTDAARMGVPLFLSDHDPVLTAELMQRPWVCVFRAGDASDLAEKVTQARAEPLPRPGPSEAAAFGLITNGAALTILMNLLQARLPAARVSPDLKNCEAR